ncbi:MAG: DUF4097 family beta strand repeat protein [Oscillospiraceae bacterium]|nr:DUF4097 family beta strand repeat protein [Oscillospiraceae bacterium]
MNMMKKAAAACLSAALLCLSGCSVSFRMQTTGIRYSHADSYTAGDREITEPIDALDIDWPSGAVTVSTGSSNSVTIKETTAADLKDELKVHSWTDGSVLRVRFCKSGVSYREKEAKTVEITVPEGTVFETVRLDTASADAEFNGITAKKADLDAASGKIGYTGSADTFNADAASGNISFSGESGSIKANTSSGTVTLTQQGAAADIHADTASGKIVIEAEQADNISANSASGDQTLRLKTVPKKMNLDTASGDVTLYLPEDADFTADIDTASGDVSYNLPLTKSGSDTYTGGSGTNQIDIDTASGDVQILKYE